MLYCCFTLSCLIILTKFSLIFWLGPQVSNNSQVMSYHVFMLQIERVPNDGISVSCHMFVYRFISFYRFTLF